MSARTFRLLPVAIVACVLAALALGAGSASAVTAPPAAWWSLTSSAAPTNLQPGTEGFVIAYAINAGDIPVKGEAGKIVLKDTLPAGLEIVNADSKVGPDFPASKPKRDIQDVPCAISGQVVTCEWEHEIPHTESFRLKVRVKVPSGATEGSPANTVQVSGGGITPASLSQPVNIRAAATKFGVENYEFRPENAQGGIETQAGSHPFQLTTNFNLNESVGEIVLTQKPELLPESPALAKNLHFILPPGMIGKAAKVPQCSQANFATLTPGAANLCPERTAIGIANATIDDPTVIGWREFTVPVFNLTPSKGEPARFGFEVYNTPVVLSTHVRSGSDYGVEVTVSEASEAAYVLATQLTLWGVPEQLAPRQRARLGMPAAGLVDRAGKTMQDRCPTRS